MFRPSASPRLFAGFALAAVVGTGIGLGIASLGSSPATPAPLAQPALPAAATTAEAPGTSAAPAPASAPLTVDQVKAIALQASPGTVVDVQQDNEASDPTDAPDPTETTDPNEPNEAAEPTGAEYEVTVLHSDGTATQVNVDAKTGRVASTKQEDDWNGN